MTKQTYRDVMDSLKAENTRLQQRIRELERQPDIIDDRPLDDIINGYREETDSDAELPKPITFQKKQGGKPAENVMSGFMDHYREYRRLYKQSPLTVETVFDTSAVDVSSLDMVKAIFKAKPV